VHVWIALATAFLLLALGIRSITPQMPREPRSRPAEGGMSGALTPSPGALVSGPELAALKFVLRDLAPRLGALRDESSRFYSDAHAMWSLWKTEIGVRGAPFGSGGALRPPMDPESEARAQRLQSELFRLDSRAGHIRDEVAELTTRFSAVRDRWSDLSRLALQAPRGQTDLEPALSAPVWKLRSELAAISSRLGQLDSDLMDREEEFDELFPRYERFLLERGSTPVTFRFPEHWNRMAADQPRRSLRYDFDAKFESYASRYR